MREAESAARGATFARLAAVWAVVALLAVSASPARADHRGGPPRDEIAVICGPYTFNNFNNERWYWGVEPRRCDLVKRGEESYGATTVELRHMRWPTWNQRKGLGRGKTLVNTIGKTPVRAKLYRPRTRCGHETFTRALLKYTSLDERGRMPLNDWCL